MKPRLHDLAHEIAREQIAYWRFLGWEVADAAAVLDIRRHVDAWRDIEDRLAWLWRGLQKLEQVAA